jgi:hypothetical protein
MLPVHHNRHRVHQAIYKGDSHHVQSFDRSLPGGFVASIASHN